MNTVHHVFLLTILVIFSNHLWSLPSVVDATYRYDAGAQHLCTDDSVKTRISELLEYYRNQNWKIQKRSDELFALQNENTESGLSLAVLSNFLAPKSLADPKTIRFSQDSIKGTFRDGRSVQDLAAGLKNGSIKPGDVPAIRTVQRNGQTISIDNRRLSAFREAGVPIRTRPATAKEIIQAERQGKFSTGASGTDNIRIRGQ